jgi:hypothetical protein
MKKNIDSFFPIFIFCSKQMEKSGVTPDECVHN